MVRSPRNAARRLRDEERAAALATGAALPDRFVESPKLSGAITLGLQLSSRDLDALPGDLSGDPGPRYVPGAVWCRCDPVPVSQPLLVLAHPEILSEVGLRADDERVERLVAGELMPSGAAPAAFNYCGHQFGSFAGQLGDGAAVSLGVAETAGGRLELQLKGVGPTPLCREGLTGKKSLAALTAEFIQSEALHRLAIPTVRAAAVVAGRDAGGSDVGAMLRVGRSLLRFGTLELANQPARNGKQA